MDFIKELPKELIIIITAVLFWLSARLIHEIVTMLKKSKDDIEQDVTELKKQFNGIQSDIRRHSEIMKISTEALVEVKFELKRLNEYLFKIPKLEADINYAHEKIRSMQNGQ